MTVNSPAMSDSRKPDVGEVCSMWAFPSAIVALGLVLRLYRLNYQSVWYDEIFSLTVSHQSLHEMGQYLIKDFVQPPLHYFVLHAWFKLVGFGPYQGRLLSVILGTLGIVATYILGQYLFDRWAASIAALLLAVSQLAVMYSQEARPYAQLIFLIPCCSYLFLVALRTGRAGAWWGFVCAAILVGYTHYYGFFAVASFLLFATLYRKRYRVPVSRWIGGIALALALYLPWLSSGIITEWLHSSKSLSHTPSRVYLPWFTVLTSVNTFNNGRSAGLLESSPWWTYVLGGLFFSVPVLIALTPLMKQPPSNPAEHLMRENLWFLLILFIIPFSAGLAVGFKSGAYNIRYITFVIVPYYLLVSRGISVLDRAALRTTLLVACLAYSANSLRANYLVPYKEDYRDAYAYLAQARQADDCYVVAPTYEERQARWAWAIYHGSQLALPLAPLDAVVSGQESCPRVWLISVMYRSTPPAVKQSKEAQQLLEQGHARIEERHFFWVDLDLYVLKSH
jgi:mannosyltransferase